MKKPLRILCILAACVLCFMLGWRVMPRVWPDIKSVVLYPIFPQLRPTAAASEAEQELYVPKTSAAFSDPVAGSDSLVYYFYKDYCPYCRALEPLTAGLPAQLTLPDGSVSAVRFVAINKVEEAGAQVIEDYYEAHEIPEDRRLVPAIVIGGRYLYLRTEIVEGLLPALVAGEGLQTPVLNGTERGT